MPSLNEKRRAPQPKAQPKQKAPLVVAFRCPPDLRVAIKVRAAQEQSSTEQVLVNGMREYLGVQEEGATA